MASAGGFRGTLDALSVAQSDFVTPDRVVQLGLPPYRIDLLTSISGVEFAEAWEGRFESKLFGVPVAVLGRHEFIRNKLASARPKDLADVEALGGAK